MEYEQFKKQLLKEMEKILSDSHPGYKIALESHVKHGQDKDALVITQEGKPAGKFRSGVVLYADDMYPDAKAASRTGAGETEVVKTMARQAIDAVMRRYDSIDFEPEQFVQKEYVLTNVMLNLVNAKLYQKTLVEVPHMPIGDMALTYNVVASDDGETIMHFMVTDAMAEEIGTNLVELHESAMRNTQQRYPEQLEKIADGKYGVTAAGGVCRASAFVYNGVLKQLARRLGGDLLIVPASTEGTIIVREDAVPLPSLIRFLADENRINERDEILSQNILRYDRKDERLDVCAGYGVREVTEGD